MLYSMSMSTPFNSPPDCSGAVPSKSILWPRNHQFQAVTIEGVTDSDGDDIAIEILEIYSDEKPDTAKGADATGLGTSTAHLRAQCSGEKPHNGRVYTISFKATDEKEAYCLGTVKVGVPHKKKDDPVDDSPPQYDMTV